MVTDDKGVKYKIFISVYNTLQMARTSTLRQGHIARTVKALVDIHVPVMCFYGYMVVGKKGYAVKNLQVEWVKPGPKGKATGGKAASREAGEGEGGFGGPGCGYSGPRGSP